MAKSYILHGLLQDVIDYSMLIKARANTPCNDPFKVTKSRKSLYGYCPNKKINKKGHSLGMIRR